MKRIQPLQSASGRSILTLWLLLALGTGIPLRRSTIFTDHPFATEGWEGILGAPVYVFAPILGTYVLVLYLTLRWWRARSRG